MDNTPTKALSDEVIGVIGCIIVAALIIGYGIGQADGKAGIRQEAIKAGAARWEADEQGNTHIKWLPQPEEASCHAH